MHTSLGWVAMLSLGWLVACSDAPNEGSGTGQGGGSSSAANTSGTGASSNNSTGTGAMPPTFTGYTQVDGAGSAVKGGADVAVAPDGTIYVSWVDVDHVVVKKSSDGGQTFGAPVVVDPAAAPIVSMARHPYVVADLQRVAVSFNDPDGTVYLYTSPAGDMAFDQGRILGTDITTDFRDFPKPLLLGDGSLVVAWQGYPTTGARIFLSRETNDFASEAASSGAPGVPCECCPLDLWLSDAGDLLVAFRNNDNFIRDMWVATAPLAGAFNDWTNASMSEGNVMNCPMQGPRLAETSTGGALMVWSSRGASSQGAVFISSSNGGAWSGGASLGGLMAEEPTIAIGASGRIYVTAVTGADKSSMTWSDDQGGSWTAPEALAAPDGDVSTPQAESGAGIAALAGVSAAGNVWLLRME